MGVFTANTIYRHMSEAHQGFYDDEPIIQGVDIQEQYDLLRRIQDQNTLAQRMQPANVDRRDQAPRAAEQQRVDMMVDAARRRLEEVARRPPQWEELVRQRQHREEEARRQQHREQEARRRQHQEEDARQQQQLLRRQQERVQHDSGNGWNCLIM
ncbi:hypothetical protein ID866_5491 [Astraeus odoratus]|nr:hypothetical protein ID866_5491 [Astraeus odoratus]